MVQWNWTDNGIWQNAVGHMGFHWTVHPVPWYSGTGRTVGYGRMQWDTWDSIRLSILSHGTEGLDGDMAECNGTHGIPLDCPSCPMVQRDWTGIWQNAVGHMGFHWTVHPVPWYIQWDWTDTGIWPGAVGHMGFHRLSLCPMVQWDWTDSGIWQSAICSKNAKPLPICTGISIADLIPTLTFVRALTTRDLEMCVCQLGIQILKSRIDKIMDCIKESYYCIIVLLMESSLRIKISMYLLSSVS